MDDDEDFEELSDVEFLRELSERIFNRLTPAMGFNQYDSDRLLWIAQKLEISDG